MDQKNRTFTGGFSSKTREEDQNRVFASYDFEKEKRKNQSPSEKRKWNSLSPSYRKLLRNTAVCAVLALGIWGMKSLDASFANEVSKGMEEAVSGQYTQDEDLGKLKFVGATVEGEEMLNYCLPLDGEILESFADSGKSTTIKSGANTMVKAIVSGKVLQTEENSVTILNENGTQTVYQGVIPGVKAGEMVDCGQNIGQLAEEVLCLETVSGIGYVNSLDATELAQASGGDEPESK